MPFEASDAYKRVEESDVPDSQRQPCAAPTRFGNVIRILRQWMGFRKLNSFDAQSGGENEWDGFHFGLETEFMLVAKDSFHPMWHKDLSFAQLNGILENIPFADLGSVDGLILEPPHRKNMPFVVEGYHMPGPDGNCRDLLPKGLEIRTPISSSIDDCLDSFVRLHARMQFALENIGLTAVSLSHHPIECAFEGPSNNRRYDFWRWAEVAMCTYGPDVNISLPKKVAKQIDEQELDAKVNYYGPSLTALTLASPFCNGDLWCIRGIVGKSLRTYRRSIFAPMIELHPEEANRMEFKTFETSCNIDDFRRYFLLWLALVLDNELPGRATYQSRIYDLGAIAREGLQVRGIIERASHFLKQANRVLPRFGFDPLPLQAFWYRLEKKNVPADHLIELYQQEGTIEGVLRHLVMLRRDMDTMWTSAA